MVDRIVEVVGKIRPPVDDTPPVAEACVEVMVWTSVETFVYVVPLNNPPADPELVMVEVCKTVERNVTTGSLVEFEIIPPVAEEPPVADDSSVV